MRSFAMALAVAAAVGLGFSFAPAASAETVKKVIIKKHGDRGMHRGHGARVVIKTDRGRHRGWRNHRGHHYGSRPRSSRTVVKKVIRRD